MRTRCSTTSRDPSGTRTRSPLTTWTPPRLVRAAARDTGALLAGWLGNRNELALPWLRADTRWQVISAEALLDRLALDQARLLWPFVAQWPTPAATLAAREELIEAAS